MIWWEKVLLFAHHKTLHMAFERAMRDDGTGFVLITGACDSETLLDYSSLATRYGSSGGFEVLKPPL
jgi:hypothetical protein